MVLTAAGRVGIGTTNPQELLSVSGNILAKKVKVSIQSSDWPDYVFDSSYQLPALEKVEAFIKVNKHLPQISSAEEIYKNGLDLGENQSKLLQKIEELTLYMIETNRKLAEQQKKIESLTTELQKVKSRKKQNQPTTYQ